MAIESGSTGSSTTGSFDLNSVIQSAIAGGTMSDLFGGKSDGSNFILGALLGRLLFNNNDLNGTKVATADQVDSIQQNNNAMLLLKDIQDSSQDVIAAVNAASQTNLVQQLQGQISNLQGQADIKTQVVSGNANVVNEVNAVNQNLSNQLNTVNTNMLKGFADLGSKIDQNLITELREQLAEQRTRSSINEGNVTVTNNINQTQQQQQQQQQIWNINNLLQDLLAQQKITQGIVNLGTMTGSAGSQTAANTRVNS